MADHLGTITLHATTSLLPVCLFLLGLVGLDSFKLVRVRDLGGAVAAGLVAAGISYILLAAIADGTGWGLRTMARYVAPFVEESAKALFVVFLIRTHRVGFVVDAAVLGFAVGTGFALVENVFYLQTRGDLGWMSWVVRGFGTALMHGGATSVFAMISKTLADRTPAWHVFIPGLVVVYAVHSLFNHFVLPPPLMAGLYVAVLPGLMAVVFYRSERATRQWIGRGFDADQRLLEELSFHRLGDDRLGRYLRELTARFPGEVVADMLCLVRLRAELSIKAKGLLLMREAGFRPPSPAGVQESLDEFYHLAHRIGPTGMLALRPVLRREHREIWERRLLGA